MKAAALILAAGRSKRLGQPKQLLRLGGETLLDRSIRIAAEAGCSPVAVVLGAFEEQIRRECDLRKALVISHPGWADGMGSSLARGIQDLRQVEGVLVMTCDMPSVTPRHLCALASSGETTASLYAGRKGVPAYFPCALFPELLRLHGDVGARALLEAAPTIALPEGSLDIDTQDSLREAQRLFS